jgi:hypothetical protein
LSSSIHSWHLTLPSAGSLNQRQHNLAWLDSIRCCLCACHFFPWGPNIKSSILSENSSSESSSIFFSFRQPVGSHSDSFLIQKQKSWIKIQLVHSCSHKNNRLYLYSNALLTDITAILTELSNTHIFYALEIRLQKVDHISKPTRNKKRHPKHSKSKPNFSNPTHKLYSWKCPYRQVHVSVCSLQCTVKTDQIYKPGFVIFFSSGTAMRCIEPCSPHYQTAENANNWL